jgi:hypothetical protein
MSLIVQPYRRADTGAIVDLDISPTPPHNDLAGFENWRTTVWGSGSARALGCVLLPRLAAEPELYVEAGELDELQAEVESIIEHAQSIVGPEHGAIDGLVFRARNILEAIRLARLVEGGVYIG